MSRELDVVIIGGGIQGLVALDALVDRGYACALVTDGDLGSGQSLHSHGFLFTGFGMFGDHLQRASADIVQPYLRARGVEPTGEWFLIPPPGFPTGFPAAALPDGFGDSLGEIVRTPDRSFPKHRLVETLSRKHPDRVVRGRVTLAPAGRRTPAVKVQPAASGEELALNGKVIIVAAGCGSKRILQGLVGDAPQPEQIRHRRVHMICVRGPRGLLPTISVTAMPLGVTLAAHDQPDSDNVIWYVTPLEFGGPSFDDIPGDAASDIDSATVARGFEALLQLYPALPEVEHLELGCYAGYRQEIGDQPGMAMCELVHDTKNVIVALPSGLVSSWLNVGRIVEIIDDLVDPSGTQPVLAVGGVGVQVGSVVEDRPDFAWQTFAEFAKTYQTAAA
jgi:hypothetical protein